MKRVVFPIELRQEHRFAPRLRPDRNTVNYEDKGPNFASRIIYTLNSPTLSAPIATLSNLQVAVPFNLFEGQATPDPDTWVGPPFPT
jgi:hypothetical protein